MTWSVCSRGSSSARLAVLEFTSPPPEGSTNTGLTEGTAAFPFTFPRRIWRRTSQLPTLKFPALSPSFRFAPHSQQTGRGARERRQKLWCGRRLARSLAQCGPCARNDRSQQRPRQHGEEMPSHLQAIQVTNHSTLWVHSICYLCIYVIERSKRAEVSGCEIHEWVTWPHPSAFSSVDLEYLLCFRPESFLHLQVEGNTSKPRLVRAHFETCVFLNVRLYYVSGWTDKSWLYPSKLALMSHWATRELWLYLQSAVKAKVNSTDPREPSLWHGAKSHFSHPCLICHGTTELLQIPCSLLPPRCSFSAL